jgi:predicted metal-dependent hydrolase
VNSKYNEAKHKGESGEFIGKASRASFTCRVQFEFNLKRDRRSSAEEFLALTKGKIPIALIHNKRARRYVLRLRPDGSGRVTVPRGGSVAEARRFADRNVAWIERAQRLSTFSARPQEWLIGTKIHFRGELVTIEAGVNGESGQIRFGTETIKVKEPDADLRRVIERQLWKLCLSGLPSRRELAQTEFGSTEVKLSHCNRCISID